MNKKRVFAVLFVLALAVVLFNNVLVQGVGGVDSGAVAGDAGKILNATSKLQEFTQENRTNFLGQQWKELLLKNGFIAGADKFFRQVNFLFVILFSRNYDLSLELFIAFLIWFFTFLSLTRYTFVLFKQGWEKWLVSFGGVLILAHIQLFNSLSSIIVKIIFYKKEWYWELIILLVIIVAIVFYYLVNKYVAALLKKSKEEKEKRELEFRVEKSEVRAKSIKKMAG